MKFKYKNDIDDEKKLKPSSSKNQLIFKNPKSCLLWSILGVLFIWVLYVEFLSSSQAESPDAELCYGYMVKNKLCKNLSDFEITGNLCMDLCVDGDLYLPSCVNQDPFMSKFSEKFRYFQQPQSETTLIYVENNGFNILNEKLTLEEFKELITDLIMRRLRDPYKVEKIVDRIIYATDVNKDQKLNYQEANTLWMLLNNKATFYMLVLGDKWYVPRIKNLCGGLVQLEEIKGHLNQPKDYSLIKSVFSSSIYWYKLKPLYRLKIALGILEFFSQATEFNPNDEFGPDSLLLCSPIQKSFGFTFFNDAKLINFDWVLTSSEAFRLLINPNEARSCRTDLDCVLTDQCVFKCDLNTNRCSQNLVRPQIVDFCEFLAKFIEDEKNISAELSPLIKKCHQLEPFYADNRVLYGKSEMPLAYHKVGEFVERREFWTKAEEYSILINDLESVIWERVRLAPDPKKAKKKAVDKNDQDKHPTSP